MGDEDSTGAGPSYDADHQGVSADPGPVFPRKKERRSLYVGAHTDLVQRLRDGETPTAAPILTPRAQALKSRRGRAAVYARVSTEEQARMGGGQDGFSIPYQREACERYAREHDLEIVDVYIDPGKSGTTTNRKRFKEMLTDLAERNITHIIVHKLDRLSRSPKVDYVVDEAREATKTTLVSVTEYIDETPQGLLNLQFMRGVAAYYSNNLAAEVHKGITTKLKEGGTPGLAPLGYVNKQRKEGRADIRWIEIDEERAPHIRWAFEEYATGNWSLQRLVVALEARGLRNRGRQDRPSRPITAPTLHRLLSSPYYVGIVVYNGGYYEGSHPPLIARNLWLRVQDILAAHNTAGEKDRKHPHYLKGTIYCGECGNRLIYSQNRGKGGIYEYFFCIGRRAKAAPCTRKYVSLPRIEDGVEDFYRSLHFSAERVDAIRHVVRDELEKSQADATFTLGEARRRHAVLKNEQASLLQAHYAGAVPLDLLKQEMDRTTREVDAAARQIATAEQALEQLDEQLERALEVARLCGEQYSRALASERRLLNQGLFKKLFIGEDGSVEHAEVQELFAGILSRDASITTEVREVAMLMPPKQHEVFGAPLAATGTDEHLVPVEEWGNRPERRWNPEAALLSFQTRQNGTYVRTPPKLSFGRGSNNTHVADVVCSCAKSTTTPAPLIEHRGQGSPHVSWRTDPRRLSRDSRPRAPVGVGRRPRGRRRCLRRRDRPCRRRRAVPGGDGVVHDRDRRRRAPHAGVIRSPRGE
ncbi:recombinase family protein [Microbacterium sp. SORGH_AS_0888]|uniref:recombinase family protein n=1 Tax=Microbacterium sp. SORGH_AS_0888 TaxID=3041791 RepID=UPI002785B75D|nr:recombinase family protein [Microbacterium sp. SORGH_AS_0888]MDQ1130408.1 site-specific DNA recombinase [Microbacterium sp. SORGH_AS_0888]